ncbi:MAG: hypothetical protein FWD61_16855 [Phycisphaerales bacterium]|nr:hypothetical protein [Phycisphaerales bacterium]
MLVTLSPQTNRLLQQKLSTGSYRSADDVLLAALEALDAADHLDRSALDAIDRAEDQIERGQVREWKDIREQVRAKFLGK